MKELRASAEIGLKIWYLPVWSFLLKPQTSNLKSQISNLSHWDLPAALSTIQAESRKGLADILSFPERAHSMETGTEEPKPSRDFRLSGAPKIIQKLLMSTC